MPIWKRYKMERTSIKCEGCELKGVDVDLQPSIIDSENINYVLNKIDWENTPFFNSFKDEKKRNKMMSFLIFRGNYIGFSCYVCGWFKLVKT